MMFFGQERVENWTYFPMVLDDRGLEIRPGAKKG